jgi:hypothetical protein
MSKARWFKGHGDKVAVRAPVRFVAVGLEISEENRPKRTLAGIDQGPLKMFSEYAIAPFLDFDDLVLNLHQIAVPVNHQSGKTSPSHTTLQTDYIPVTNLWPVNPFVLAKLPICPLLVHQPAPRSSGLQ